MRIVEIREVTKPIASPIRNAYIDFSKMTLSLVAVVTDVIRDGKPVRAIQFSRAAARCSGQAHRGTHCVVHASQN